MKWNEKKAVYINHRGSIQFDKNDKIINPISNNLCQNHL